MLKHGDFWLGTVKIFAFFRADGEYHVIAAYGKGSDFNGLWRIDTHPNSKQQVYAPGERYGLAETHKPKNVTDNKYFAL
ncbi:MAG: hypothetical protein V1839_03105 [archaeon]